MTTFEIEYNRFWDHETPINWLLALPFEIEGVMIEIEYDISKYYPATFWQPEEGGEIEDWNVKVTDEMFNEKQSEIIKDSLNEEWIIDAIWDHYQSNKNKVDDWY